MPDLARKEPKRVYSDKMVFSKPILSLANHLKLIYVTNYLEGEEYIIRTDLTVSSFNGAITITHGILPLKVDLGSKQIMLAFFVVDNNINYRALLGRDWIHRSLYVPSTLN